VTHHVSPLEQYTPDVIREQKVIPSPSRSSDLIHDRTHMRQSPWVIAKAQMPACEILPSCMIYTRQSRTKMYVEIVAILIGVF